MRSGLQTGWAGMFERAGTRIRGVVAVLTVLSKPVAVVVREHYLV